MNALLKLLKVEPVAMTTLLSATVALLAFFGVNKVALGVFSAFIAALLVVVRQMVSPVERTVKAVTMAAEQAAEATAANLDAVTAGVKGTVTAPAASLVTDVAKIATSTALRLVGINRKTQTRTQGEGISLPE